MAMWLFAAAIAEGRPIRLFNHGRMRRDFTYVDDAVEALVRLIDKPPAGDPGWSGEAPDPATSRAPWRVYNIGNDHPVEVTEVVRLIEQALGKQAIRELAPMQPGDLPETRADVADLAAAVGFSPKTPIADGVGRFIAWYRDYADGKFT
jgi:UDP-glucuronate 4-epimerase